MIATENITLSFGGALLFEDVSLKFTNENCYGLIGANGAGKSTFLRILSGEIDSTKGKVLLEKGKRIAVLKQDQFAFDDNLVLETVLMGHQKLYDIYKERNDLYSKPTLTDAEGLRAGDLECLFGDMDGYVAESDAATMLSELGIPEPLHQKKMKDLEAGQKIRVLLAQALFGNPDVLLLDEPTNQLDYATVVWLENFLLDFKNTVIVVSHNRHFLNKVCTHIADVDYKKIKIHVGNYDFWQESSQLAQSQKQDHNKKNTDRIKELEDFIRRFSANASKSKQATSRKKLIEKLRPEELPTSSRRAPYISFKPKRPCGNTILSVKNLTHKIDSETVLKDISFTLNKNEKIALIGPNTVAKTTLLQLLAGELTPDRGTIEWGETISRSYFPKDNSAYFTTKMPLLDWLSQYTDQTDMQFIRGFLGRMLFSGDDVNKSVTVLSGGEKARGMFSRMMLAEGNFLILDEPTDHLDLESISALNKGLETFTDCLIFTSQDFQLLDTVANRIIEILPNGTIIDRLDTFSDYMDNPKIQALRG